MLPFSILMPVAAPITYRPAPEATKAEADQTGIACLCCGRPFPSRGPEHRVCDTCKLVDEKS